MKSTNVSIGQQVAILDDLRNLLDEVSLIERKDFIRSFVKRIDVDKEQLTLQYKLSLPIDEIISKSEEVPPTITFGGAQCTISRTFSTNFTIGH